MPDYLLLMHDDTPDAGAMIGLPISAGWQASGNFQGGSAIGEGICARKSALRRPSQATWEVHPHQRRQH